MFFYPGPDFNPVIVNPHLEMLNRVYSRTSDRFASSEIEAGAMMGTDDLAADLATAFQREIKMRAAVLNGKHIVAGAADENGSTEQGICAMLAIGDFG